MRYLIVAALLIACPAWPQVPRDGGQPQQKPQTDKAQTQPVAPPSTNSVEIKPSPPKQPEQSQPKPEGYHWRELYAPVNIPNWVLAVLAGWAGFMALRTLSAIERQVGVMRDQSNEMVTQRLLTMQTLRPRLSITGFINSTFKEALAGDWVFVKMQISNSGGMPAYGVLIDTWIEFLEGEPPNRLSSEARYRQSPPISIHTGEPSGFSIPLHRKLTEDERQKMAKAKGAILFRVRMNYRALSEEVHTDETYIVRPDSMDVIGEYTSAT